MSEYFPKPKSFKGSEKVELVIMQQKKIQKTQQVLIHQNFYKD